MQVPNNDEPTADLDAADEGLSTRWEKALADADRSQAEDQAGDQIGAYRLLAVLGEGGFGTVWLAERREPFIQRVALKLIKPGMDSKSVIARFEQERQALAVMSHPGIAKVLDGGLTPRGRPYFAMEYVKGEPVTEFCDSRRLSIRERLELFTQACEAVQHAHLKGIVHRDLKPSNILAFEIQGEGFRVKVIDFGVAKAMTQPLTAKTIFTETGQMIGTPAYMSPEQADPASSDVDTRSDIYSLGVLLYELVTGALPFDPKELRARGYAEIQRVIREEDPPTPSARLTTIATKDSERASAIEQSRRVALRQLAKELRSELEWIPLRAMRKDPKDRYQTALDFARDLRNYLEGKPISAAPESQLYRLRKWAKRRRTALRVAALLSLVFAVGLSIQPAQTAYRRFSARWSLLERSKEFREDLRSPPYGIGDSFVEQMKPDPAVVPDPDVRRRIEDSGLPWKIRHRVSGIELLLVPPGEFDYGVDADWLQYWHFDLYVRAEFASLVPQRRMIVRNAFYLSTECVSVEVWQRVTGLESTVERWREIPDLAYATRDQVESEFFPQLDGYFRLPTSVEWEYACKAGSSTPYYWGQHLVRIGEYFRPPEPNPWGFVGMQDRTPEIVATDCFASHAEKASWSELNGAIEPVPSYVICGATLEAPSGQPPPAFSRDCVPVDTRSAFRVAMSPRALRFRPRFGSYGYADEIPVEPPDIVIDAADKVANEIPEEGPHPPK